jgi:ssDNA-binding replication factor A large subunit
LKVGLRKVDIKGTLVLLGQPKKVNTRAGDELMMVKAKLTDDTGAIPLTLFGDLALTPDGSKVSIKNGYTSEWPAGSGTVQLNVGRYGKLEIL